ncbi:MULTISPECIES: LysR family transcriptional regulator [Paracidovorax]|uniref:DNA-binding transcriptional regulator, LysR family n=1 Tax=Paracidovorax cattleyae TaxID=80868 RepID=A0A1H0VMT0_9BURK|nr:MULTISPECIES: LysR family transcriptional regulator [Paracidovorax]AVS63525.1 LysR family transcriptional regulator [Paracidovorax avenae]AVS75852.1 LysR family transcriptional regulator [Paracidovorax cattleyae]MBF9266539.1 LysR family transcriptional regulator [Paracidovorax cattleyae]SDP79807.1 DNA-binding transcriptional regulator, LysR family [Paracidovorax cattleyae]
MNRSPLIARQLQDTALRYFLEVVRCGSISEASARLSVAGSAISRQIAHLEDVLGAALFERHARGMVPSSAGELLATHALKSAHDAERVVQEIQSLQGMRRGRVRIASAEGFAMEFLPRLISDFHRQHPGVQFHLSVHAPGECTRRVLLSDADIGIVMSRHTEKDIKVEHLQPSPVGAAMRQGHPLSRFRQISLSQLLAYPIALPEADTTVRQLFDIACSRQRLAVEPVLTSNYISALFGFLRHREDGVTICGEISGRNQVDRGELAFVRLRDKGLDLRNIEVQTLIGRTQPKAVQAFLEHLRQGLGGTGLR